MCTRSSDAGHADTGQADARHANTGRADAGHAETGHADAGHADAGPGKHVRGLTRIAAVLALLVAIDVALCYVLEPYGAAAEVTWYDYRNSADEDIDTLVVGTSYAQRGLAPHAIDEALGSNSFSLATPAQALYDSVEATRTAIADHHVQRVILGLGANSLTELPWFNAQITFWQAASAGQPLSTWLHYLGNMVLDEDNVGSARSLLWVFPWNFSNVGHNPAHIADNVRRRLTCANPLEASASTNPDWRYVGRGHGTYDDVYDQTGLSTPEVVLDDDAPLLDSALARIAELCELCAQNDVELYVVNVARPAYVTLAHQGEEAQEFVASMTYLRDFVSERGATYLDFNLARPEFYRPARDEFSDESHLNSAGSERFCHALGEVIAALERGGADAQAARKKFYAYEDWDELLESFEPIEICYADTTWARNELVVEAHSIARPDVEVEYEFWVDGQVVQEFSAKDSCRCVPADEGDAIIEIHARADDYEYVCHRVQVR